MSEPETIECPVCRGSGRGQPIATGFESAGRINDWLMSQPCGRCKGTGKVPVPGHVGCASSGDTKGGANCTTLDESDEIIQQFGPRINDADEAMVVVTAWLVEGHADGGE